MPLVLIDRYTPGISANYVVLDNYNATYSAVNHFIEKGYKNTGMIAYISEFVHMQERIRGYKEAMRDHGLMKMIQLKEAVKILIDQIKGTKNNVHIELKHELIIRASCG
jgi:LacI family transcriptional regulator